MVKIHLVLSFWAFVIVSFVGEARGESLEQALREIQLWRFVTGNYRECHKNRGKCFTMPEVVIDRKLPPPILGRVEVTSPNVVKLRPNLTGEELEQVLVHEFTHVLQLRFNPIQRYDPCIAFAWELEAYMMNRLYAETKKHSMYLSGEEALKKLQVSCLE